MDHEESPKTDHPTKDLEISLSQTFPSEIVLSILSYLPKRDLKLIAASLPAFRDDAQRRIFTKVVSTISWSMSAFFDGPDTDGVRAAMTHEADRLNAIATNSRISEMVQVMSLTGHIDYMFGVASPYSPYHQGIAQTFFSMVSSSWSCRNVTHVTLKHIIINGYTLTHLGTASWEGSLESLALHGCPMDMVHRSIGPLSLKSLKIHYGGLKGLQSPATAKICTPNTIQILILHDKNIIYGFPEPYLPQLTRIHLSGVREPEDVLAFISKNCPKVIHIVLNDVEIPLSDPQPPAESDGLGLFPALATLTGSPDLLRRFSRRSPLPSEITFTDVRLEDIEYELYRDNCQETLNRDGVRSLTISTAAASINPQPDATSNDEGDKILESYGSIALAAYETRYYPNGVKDRVSEAIQAIKERLSQETISAPQTQFFVSCITSPPNLNIPSLETLCIEYPVECYGLQNVDSPAVPTRPRKHTLLAALDYIAAEAWMNENPGIAIGFVQVATDPC